LKIRKIIVSLTCKRKVMKKAPFNKAMIYDDNCPLCKAYTETFVRTGFLRHENRIAFSNLQPGEFDIDWNKARHEIPLVDRDTKKVVYGIDALTIVLQQKLGIVAFFMKLKPIHWFFKKLYKLISYNRRLIVADGSTNSCGIDCRPDFNLKYRLLLIGLLFFISSVLFFYTARLYQLPLYCISISSVTIIPFFLMPSAKHHLLDIGTHFSIITLIMAFLMLLTALTEKFFFTHYLLISGAGIAITTIVVIKQIIRRYKFIIIS
jgi:predicted DCC family thiol-disulfide oxidoreductase YuxK